MNGSSAEPFSKQGKYNISIPGGQGIAIGDHAVVYNTIVQQYPSLKDYAKNFAPLIDNATRWFTGREFVFDQLANFQNKYPSGYFCIEAGAGLGKTAIAAELTKRYKAPAHFFKASEGITRPEDCLNHLCVQLIARFELPYDHLPVQAGQDPSFLSTLLEEVAELLEGKSLLIVVDALDEADAPPRGHNLINLPNRLPHGLYFVLTHRPGRYPISVDPPTGWDLLTIKKTDQYQQEDIETFLWKQTERVEIERVLEGAQPPISPSQFVAVLKEASEGVFIYLSFVLADIAAMSATDAPLRMEELPKGLGGYYEHFWSNIEQVKEAEGYREWKELYRPIIELLGAVSEPVTIEWLATLADRDAEEVRDRALLRWQRFLINGRSNGIETWHIVHRSFADFLEGKGEFLERKIDLQATHRRIAEYYRDQPERWPANNGYALRQLSYHLVKAEMSNDLTTLIEAPDWLQAQRAYDLTLRTYALDVERALTFAENDAITGLPKVLAWSLLYGTLASRATNVWPDALEAMALLGDSEQALRYASLIANLDKRATAHLRIGVTLHHQGLNEASREVMDLVLDDADRITEQELGFISSEISSALVEMKYLEGLERLWIIANRMRDQGPQSVVLTNLSGSIAQLGFYDQALAILDQIQLGEHTTITYSANEMIERSMSGGQTLALTAVASALVAAGDYSHAENLAIGNLRVQAKVASDMFQAGEHERARHLVDSVYKAVKVMDAENPDRFSIVAILVKILPQLGDTQAALDLVKVDKKMEYLDYDDDNWENAIYNLAWTLAELGETEAHQQVIDYFLEVKRAFLIKEEEEWDTDEEWDFGEERDTEEEWKSTMAPVFARIGDFEQAWLDAGNNSWTKQQVIEIATQMNQSEWARRQAEEIQDRSLRARALISIAQELSIQSNPGSAKQVLDQAWQTASMIENKQVSAQILSQVARVFAQSGEERSASQSVEQLLPLIEDVNLDEYRTILGLIQLAESLINSGDPDIARQIIERAYRAAPNAERDPVELLCRAVQGLVKLGNDVQARQVLNQAEQEALNITDDDNSRAKALVNIVETQFLFDDRAADNAIIDELVTLFDQKHNSIWNFMNLQVQLVTLLCQRDHLEQAARVAEIESYWGSSESKQSMVDTLIQMRGFSDGLAKSQELIGKESLHSILLDLAQIYINRDDSGLAQQMLEAALAESNSITSPEERVQFLVKVAEALEKSEAPEKAQKVWKSAQQTAQSLNHWHRVEALIQARGYEQVQIILEEIINESNRMDEWTKVETKCRAAEVLRQLKKPELAQQMLKQAQVIIDQHRPAYVEIETDDARLWDIVLDTAVRVGNWYQARQIVNSIRSPSSRVQALLTIINGLSEIEQYDQALSLSRRARITAQTIQDPATRARYLSNLAVILAQHGNEKEARLSSDEAFAICKTLPVANTLLSVSARIGTVYELLGDREQARQLHHRILRQLDEQSTIPKDIADGLADLSFMLIFMGLDEEACSMTGRIEEPITRALVYQHLSSSLASQKEFERAVAMATAITEPCVQCQAFTEVGWALLQDEQENRSLQMATKAADLLDASYQELTQTRLLADLAILLSKHGKTTRAKQILELSSPIARKMVASEQVAVMANAALGFDALSDVRRATQILFETRDLVSGLSDTEELISALITLAQTFTNLNDPSEARQILDQATVEINEVNRSSLQAAYLADVSLALYRLGDNPQGERLLDRALSIVRDSLVGERPASTPNSTTLNAIVLSLGQMGCWEYFRQIIEDYWCDIFAEDNSEMSSLLRELVQGLLQVQEHEIAVQVIQVFWDDLSGFDSWGFRELLSSLIGTLTEIKQYDQAQSLAESAMSRYSFSQDFSFAALPLLRGLVEAGEYDRAVQVALNTSSDHSGQRILLELGEALVEQNQFDLAMQLISIIGDDDVRIQLVEVVVKALVENKPSAVTDQSQAEFVIRAMRSVRLRGRSEVLSFLGAFSPVLSGLGVLQKSWPHIQAVEALWS